MRSVLTALLVLSASSSLSFSQDAAKSASFHHVHLNVTDPAKTIDFYKKYFGAIDVKYYGQHPALFTERSFVLLTKVDAPPPWQPHAAISHIGWAAIDGFSDFEFLRRSGVQFETIIGNLGNNWGMYVYGPDKELIEFWTGSKNHRFEHLHLWATDVEKMVGFFSTMLGLPGRAAPKPAIKDFENIMALQMGTLTCDNINVIIFGRPDFDSRWWPGGSYTKEDAPTGAFAPTKGRAIDHIAFSYRDIAPEFERMKAAGAEIVEPIARRAEGHESFFVMAPDGILVEIVRARPIPEAAWDEK